jgi:hypothetical protein
VTRRPPPSTSSRSRLGGRGIRLVALAILLAVVLVGALTIWYIFLRPAGPPPVGPGAPVIPTGAVSPAAATAAAIVLASP